MFKTILKYFFTTLLVLLFSVAMAELFLRTLPYWWLPIYQNLLEDEGCMYVYVLGESTAEGVQYEQRISPATLMAYQFDDSLQGKKMQLISLAESGTTIEFNYFKFYFETLFRPHKNALVLIYSGINEGIKNTGDENFETWKMIQHSIVLSKLSYSLHCYNNSAQKYEFRYRQIISRAGELKYRAVVSELVGNVAEYDPEVFDGDVLLNALYVDSFNSAERWLVNRQYDKAEKQYRYIQNQLGYKHPYLLHQIARCKTSLQQFDSARNYILQVPEICGYIGYADWKNKILQKVCAQPGVMLAKTFERFSDSSVNGLVGYNLINDAHHPNLRGYCIMSHEIARCVSVLYREKVKRGISEDIVKQHFGFDKEFESLVYFKLVEWFVYETFETQTREKRLARMNYYLNCYEALKGVDESILIWRLLISILEKNEKHFSEAADVLAKSHLEQKTLVRLHNGFSASAYSEEIISTVSGFHFTSHTVSRFAHDLVEELQ